MEKAKTPQDLERLLIERQWRGDLEGMAALYEDGAVLDNGSGNLVVGRDAILRVFEDYAKTGKKFEKGEQQEAVVCGDLALTSTRLPDGTVTAEIARKQSDGTWLWVIDRYSLI